MVQTEFVCRSVCVDVALPLYVRSWISLLRSLLSAIAEQSWESRESVEGLHSNPARS